MVRFVELVPMAWIRLPDEFERGYILKTNNGTFKVYAYAGGNLLEFARA